jgi:hypothetical protein
MLTKKRNLLDEIKDLVEEDMEVLRDLLEEDTEALKLTVSPEKILGRPVEQWTLEDIQLLRQLYGSGSKILLDTVYKNVLKLEAENAR